MAKILMVCLGNICRSPLAEGILRAKISDDHLIESCGTANYHLGIEPDIRSIDVAKKYDIDISNHLGQQFSEKHFDEFDFIYVMDNSNYHNVTKLAKSESQMKKVKLILNEVPNSKIKEVPDPYYGTSKDFENCYQILEEACEIIAKKINK